MPFAEVLFILILKFFHISLNALDMLVVGYFVDRHWDLQLFHNTAMHIPAYGYFETGIAEMILLNAL